MTNLRVLTVLLLAWVAPLAAAAGEGAHAPPRPLLDILADEMDVTMAQLVQPDGTRPYFVSYTVTESADAGAYATLGALRGRNATRERVLDVDVRVGDYELDNTHKLRSGGQSWGGGGGANVSTRIALEDDEASIRQALWLATDRAFKAAAKQYENVVTNLKTKVEEDDQSADFSREPPSTAVEPGAALDIDLDAWTDIVRRVSTEARGEALVYQSGVAFSATAETRTMVTSEGTRLVTSQRLLSVFVSAETRAEDGMDLEKSDGFHAFDAAGLPDEDTLRASFRRCIDMALALRAAPLVEPYTGPAILLNRAAGVFFHEIFGHRIEGHRQRDVGEGQTFTKKIDQAVLPTFLSVHDDPTQARFRDIDLRGHYRFDDEGVAAEDVTLVDEGVLRTFLLSRQPVANFPNSNGHGRRNPGEAVVARQGNLIVTSTNTVPMETLRARLLEECERQGRPYGLLFEDITGGFTTTSRGGPQAFKVLPVVVWRVWADGRPDELVRGADIVGTPLSCFDRIVVTGDDPDVFNGTCGAESGWVPVSAIAPSLLVSEIEIEKRQQAQEKLPILPAPAVPTEEDSR